MTDISGKIASLRQVLATGLAALLVALAIQLLAPDAAIAQNSPDVLGTKAQTELWRAIREGQAGSGGTLIQSEGENWRAVRNGPLSYYSAQILLVTLLILGVFFLIRGRIPIDKGPSGWLIRRFNGLERFGHWLLAVSFIILGVSGLNLLFGRYILAPLMAPETFARLTTWGKVAHNYVGFAFMAGVVLIFLMWIKDNLPSRTDIKWALQGGGIFGDQHPPAKRFNAGQKIIFWTVVLTGISISMSGLALMFPFQYPLFAKTFEILNKVGFDLPTQLTAMQEMQYSQVWHTMMAVFMLVVIFAHIYIGSLGMKGAFAAMGSGKVDLNWARQHHSLWVEKLTASGKLNKLEDPSNAEARDAGDAGHDAHEPAAAVALSAAAGTATGAYQRPGYTGWQWPHADGSGTAAPPPPDRPKMASPAPAPVDAGAVAPVAATAADDGEMRRPEGLDAARDGGADDLKRITGIGPKLETTLNELGFFHFDQIAAWSRNEVDWVDHYLSFKGRIDRDNWVAQAKLLAAGAEKS